MGLFDQTVNAQRLELGLSQAELAKRMRVSQQTVSRWVSGAVIPDLERVIALAEVLELEKESLLVYAGYLPRADRSQYWQQFAAMYEGIMQLSDKELILLLDRAWQEHRRRQGFDAPHEPSPG